MSVKFFMRNLNVHVIHDGSELGSGDGWVGVLLTASTSLTSSQSQVVIWRPSLVFQRIERKNLSKVRK